MSRLVAFTDGIYHRMHYLTLLQNSEDPVRKWYGLSNCAECLNVIIHDHDE